MAKKLRLETLHSTFILLFLLIIIINTITSPTKVTASEIFRLNKRALPTIITQPAQATPPNPPPTSSTDAKDTSTQQTTPPTSAPAPQSSNSQPNTSKNPQPTSSNSGNEPSPSSAGQTPAQSPTAPPKASTIVTVSTSGNAIITITSTSYSYDAVPTNSPTSSGSNSASSGGSSDSSGLVTAGIVVGSIVVAAAIGIWIFRKWKLSPSRNFKEKIQPVNFAPNVRDHNSDTVFLRELNEP
ncbi:7769_t:CDS:2 [Ambispora gerdemannii]|uniref:7769_t:CDS:1 n=1 Tax=Ambispora gerdemannii TaxID=144530 RepID=A0A9N8YI12_9GLOM|nr:7769_t:CDS:2 [Ambispora gerdemannii]